MHRSIAGGIFLVPIEMENNGLWIVDEEERFVRRVVSSSVQDTSPN